MRHHRGANTLAGDIRLPQNQPIATATIACLQSGKGGRNQRWLKPNSVDAAIKPMSFAAGPIGDPALQQAAREKLFGEGEHPQYAEEHSRRRIAAVDVGRQRINPNAAESASPTGRNKAKLASADLPLLRRWQEAEAGPFHFSQHQHHAQRQSDQHQLAENVDRYSGRRRNVDVVEESGR